MPRFALTALVAALIVALAAPAGAAARGPGRLFARTSFWNAPLPRRVALDRQPFSTALRAEVERETRARTGPWINTSQYSVPVYTVGPRAPRVRVQVDV